VPSFAGNTLAPSLPQSGVGFPNIPNPSTTLPTTQFVDYNGILHIGDLWNFGPLFDDGILTILPPQLLGTPYQIFVPKTDADDNGTANPLAGQITHTLLRGDSQSGRLLRTYLELGFNEDESGNQVFEGMQPHIGSVRNYINIRFSQPGRLAGTQHTEKQYPGPESPLTYQPSYDPLTGETSGLFDRCTQTGTCPKIVHTMTDIEYWEASGRGDTTDALGLRDLPLPPNVRIYQFSSNQHGGFSPVAALPTSTGICEQLPDANTYTYNLRALLVALEE
jgi:hypothetical protein